MPRTVNTCCTCEAKVSVCIDCISAEPCLSKCAFTRPEICQLLSGGVLQSRVVPECSLLLSCRLVVVVIGLTVFYGTILVITFILSLLPIKIIVDLRSQSLQSQCGVKMGQGKGSHIGRCFARAPAMQQEQMPYLLSNDCLPCLQVFAEFRLQHLAKLSLCNSAEELQLRFMD